MREHRYAFTPPGTRNEPIRHLSSHAAVSPLARRAGGGALQAGIAMSRGPRRIGQLQKKHRTSLSLCMIVKNEAETLEQCLRLARPHVDEIVVVDTGSTDGTREIARRYADVFDEIEWPDSFSIARNHSFDLAGGDFILVLDGDEYIEGEAYWRRIHRVLREPNLAAVQLPVLNLLHASQVVAADRMWQERIIRNDPRLRYIGRVHNQILDAIKAYMEAEGGRVVRAEAEVVHTGYAHSDDRMQQKYAPRLKLLEEEYHNPRSDVYRAYYGYQLGVCYFVLHRYADALEVLSEIDYARMTPENAFYAHLLAGQSAIKLNRAPVALAHCNHMFTLSRTEPVAYFTTGIALMMAGSIGDGLLMLLEAYDVNAAGGMSIRFVMNPHQLLQVLARLCGKAGLNDHQKMFATLAEKETINDDAVKALLRSLRTGIVLSEQQAA